MLTLLLAFSAAPLPRLTVEQQRLRQQRNRLFDELKKRPRSAAETLVQARAILAIERRLYGPSSRRVEQTLEQLSRLHEQLGQWRDSIECHRGILAIRRVLDGEGHWRTIDAALDLEDARRLSDMGEAKRRRLIEAATLGKAAAALHRKGDARGAAFQAKRVLEMKRELLGERHRDVATAMSDLSLFLSESGDRAAALLLARRVLVLTEQVQGKRHPEYATASGNLAAILLDLGRPRDALTLLRQSLAVRADVHGRRHEGYATALNNLAACLADLGDNKAARRLHEAALALRGEVLGKKHPDCAASMNNLAAALVRLGEYKAALALHEESLALRKEVLGEKHPDYAQSLNNLAMLRAEMGEREAALGMMRRVAAIRLAAQGEKHPDHLGALNNLSSLLLNLGQHKEGLELAERALSLRAATVGKRHPDYAESLGLLATAKREMGEAKAALPLLREALAVRLATQGENHTRTAEAMNNLGLVLDALGDPKAALPLFEKSLAIRKAALGEKHPSTARALNNLAAFLARHGDSRRAKEMHEQALAIRRETLGDKHPDTAQSLDNLAPLLERDKALALLKEALAIRKASLGEKHPDYAASLNNLAGRLDGKSVDLYRRALAIKREALGETHPDVALGLNNLGLALAKSGRPDEGLRMLRRAAALYRAARADSGLSDTLHNLAAHHLQQERPGAALPYAEEGLALTRRRLDLASAFQSERQQLDAAALLRYRLDWRLSMAEDSASLSHGHVVAWKGWAFAAQQARRAFVVAVADPATRKLAEEVQDAARSLALLAGRSDPESLKRAERFARAKDAAESRLAAASAAYRDSLRPLTSDGLRAMLPPGVILVDLLAYTGHDAAKPASGQEWTPRAAAWIVRRDAPTVRVDLGPLQPIEDAVDAWRRALEKGDDPGKSPAKLRSLVWEPLEKHLSEAKLVLVSPDGVLGRLPLNALPGKEPGTFLIEERKLAMLPIPQALRALLAPVEGRRSLLAVGGVDYGGTGDYSPLMSTAGEARAVAKLHGKGKVLEGDEATKSTLLRELPRHRFLHLATHGFFAPASMRSALDDRSATGWNPGLLSGLALAGANRSQQDGLLTAMEIAERDLSGMELAVLSACQTGLGKEAAGEGMLGLQRAFAVAGCKSVVSSLWSVDDAATAVLMERFYHHLWTGKKSKAEALRAAQLDVLRDPSLVEKKSESMRGAGLKAVKLPEGARRSPPAWWAAWQLSGDWR